MIRSVPFTFVGTGKNATGEIAIDLLFDAVERDQAANNRTKYQVLSQ